MEALSGVLIGPAELKEVYPSDLSDDQLYAFINTAHLFVDDISGLSEDKLKYCELWLSAHFLSLTDQKAKRESFGGDYTVEYIVGELGTGFKSTLYGQQALAIDTTGTLQKATAKRASLKVWSYHIDN